MFTITYTTQKYPDLTDAKPRPWYYDGDGDEWHDGILGIRTQIESPGTGWRKTTKGVDCDDKNILINKNCYKDYFIDNDGDGYDAGTISAKEQGQYQTTTLGADCDDNPTTGANVHKLNKCGKCEVEPVSGSCGEDCSKKISKTVLLELSNKLNLSIEQLLTVYNVETEGNAFRGNGDPKVLFERHYFSTLTNGKYDNSHPSLSNPIQGGYGLYSEQLKKLRVAYALDPSAAIQSASYGGFQIMGANYKAAGYSNLEDFYKDMTSANVDLHLKAFANFISSKNLIDEIQNNRWTEFASKYNGPKYKKNNYDGKMAEEYAKLISDKDLSKKDCF